MVPQVQVFEVLPKAESSSVLEDALRNILDELDADKNFVLDGLSVAFDDYRKKV